MSLPLYLNDSNSICPSALRWSRSVMESQRPTFYVCIIATITHSVFWLQFIFFPSIRQKTMQWLYAYLITDILLLFRFFFTFIVHTTSNECIPNRAWSLFICYFEAVIDNYLNILEVYILLALNICRYAQIAHNKNVYVTNIRLLTLAHLTIYLMPLISLIIQLFIGWAQLDQFVGESCDISYINVYAQIINTIIAFGLPIILNILVIYASIRHVHLTSSLRRTQHHVSAREKYNRSLVMQFLIFYTVWLSFWSPDVIVYQLTSGVSIATIITAFLNYIATALDPIIIGALDVRFRKVWRQIWRSSKEKLGIQSNRNQRRIRPNTISASIQMSRQIPETSLKIVPSHM